MVHLDENAELASRPHAFIDRSAEWMKSRFQIGKETVVFDYGCGPGLYTSRNLCPVIWSVVPE